jgi:hypothetical protein
LKYRYIIVHSAAQDVYAIARVNMNIMTDPAYFLRSYPASHLPLLTARLLLCAAAAAAAAAV